MILIPNYKTLENQTRDSIDQLQNATGWERKEVRGGGVIERARGELIINWRDMNPQPPYALHVDADMVFKPMQAIALVYAAASLDLDVVSAYYTTRGADRGVVEFFPGEYTVGPEGGIVAVNRIGFGLVVTSDRVFRKLDATLREAKFPFGRHGKAYFQSMLVPDAAYPGAPDDYLMEDHAFCHRCHGIHVPVYCDTRISVGHVGDYVFTHSDLGPRQHIQNLRLTVT